MNMTIEVEAIAEIVDVQFPDWVDPFIADFLMACFIAPLPSIDILDCFGGSIDPKGGFPTSTINLVVPDLVESIEGVFANEVLATLSIRLKSSGSSGETKLLLDLYQLDDDGDPFGPNAGDLIPLTEAPTSVTISVSAP